MATRSTLRRVLRPDVSLYSHPSFPLLDRAMYTKYPKSALANMGLSYGWPEGMPALRGRWVPESIEGNGSYITWGDVSGNGYHVTGTDCTIGSGPGTSSGRKSIVGNPSTISRMAITPKHIINGLTNWALFAVIKTPATGQSLQSFIGGSSFGGTTTNMFNVELTGTYPCTLQMRTQWGDDAAVAEKDCVLASSAISASTWYSVLFNADLTGAGTLQGYLNGASSGSGISITGAKDRLYHAAAMYLMGTNYGSDFWWKGEVSEIAIFNDKLDSTMRSDLFAYSLANYGV